MVDSGEENLPRQEAFPPTAGELVEWAQQQKILSPTKEVPLVKGGSSRWLLFEDFKFKKDLNGLQVETHWTGSHDVANLIPVGLREIVESSGVKGDWRLFFMPVYRNNTRYRIPGFANSKETIALEAALPLKDINGWPIEELDKAMALIKESRETLDYPMPREYTEDRDPWTHYLRTGGLWLEEDKRKKIALTESKAQKAFSGRSR